MRPIPSLSSLLRLPLAGWLARVPLLRALLAGAVTSGVLLGVGSAAWRLLGEVPGASANPAPAVAASVRPIEQALLSRRYETLAHHWREAPIEDRMAYGRDVLWKGGSVAIALPLIRDFWLSSPPSRSDPRLQAVKTLYLAYARIRVDGEACRDPSGPTDMLASVRSEFAPVVQFARSIPAPLRQALVLEALENEAVTAQERAPDAFLCRAGRLGGAQTLDPALALPLQARVRDALPGELLGSRGP